MSKEVDVMAMKIIITVSKASTRGNDIARLFYQLYLRLKADNKGMNAMHSKEYKPFICRTPWHNLAYEK